MTSNKALSRFKLDPLRLACEGGWLEERSDCVKYLAGAPCYGFHPRKWIVFIKLARN